MSGNRSNRSNHARLALVVSLAAVLSTAAPAVAQSRFSTARLTDQPDEFSGAGTRTGHLSQLDSQPHLAKHLTRINQFRTLFRTQGSLSSQQRDGRPPAQAAPTPSSALAPVSDPPATHRAVVPRADRVAEPDVTNLAILELEDSLSARQYPSRPYPGVGLVVVLKTISAWSETSMIHALKSGAVPIYSQAGEVIGVEDARTGLLLGGRRS